MRVHARGRLVDEDQLGRPTTAIASAEPLLLAAGEAAVRRAAAVAEPEPLDQQRRRRAGGRAARRCGGASPSRARRDQAPPRCSITPIRGSSAAPVPDAGRGPRTRTVPRLRAAVALAGLQGGGLAGAVGAEHGGDGAAVDRRGTARRRRPCRRTHHQAVDHDGRRRGSRAPRQSRNPPRRPRSAAAGPPERGRGLGDPYLNRSQAITTHWCCGIRQHARCPARGRTDARAGGPVDPRARPHHGGRPRPSGST